MDPIIRIAIVGDRLSPHIAPRAIEDALQHVARWRDRVVEPTWVDAEALSRSAARPGGFDGVWLSPETGGHAHPDIAQSLRIARDLELPLLGTGGAAFRALVDIAAAWVPGRHIPGTPIGGTAIVPSDTAEPRTPAAGAGEDAPPAAGHGVVFLEPGSRAAAAYGRWRVIERYAAERWHDAPHSALVMLTEKRVLRMVGRDDAGRARVVELPGHPFFVVARYLPHLGSAPFTPAPLARALVDAAIQCRARRLVRGTPPSVAAMPRKPAFGMIGYRE